MTEQFCAEPGSRLRATAPAGPANGCYGRVKRFFVGLATSSEQQADFKMIFNLYPFNFQLKKRSPGKRNCAENTGGKNRPGRNLFDLLELDVLRLVVASGILSTASIGLLTSALRTGGTLCLLLGVDVLRSGLPSSV